MKKTKEELFTYQTTIKMEQEENPTLARINTALGIHN